MKPGQESFLNIFPVFRKGPEGLLEELLSSSRRVSLSKNSRLYSEGDECPFIGFLLSGEIRVFKTSENGREITLYEVVPGETCILNASCILSNRSYPAEATVSLEGEILLLEGRTFRRLMTDHETMRDFIFKLFVNRFSAIIELIEEVAFGRMDARLMEYLIEKAENDRITSTHQQIANDLGTSREVVSRLLKDLERKKKVVLARNLVQLINE
jgi:CRP/FNR family transcriptional regulator, anaerobic regulatory protein